MIIFQNWVMKFCLNLDISWGVIFSWNIWNKKEVTMLVLRNRSRIIVNYWQVLLFFCVDCGLTLIYARAMDENCEARRASFPVSLANRKHVTESEPRSCSADDTASHAHDTDRPVAARTAFDDCRLAPVPPSSVPSAQGLGRVEWAVMRTRSINSPLKVWDEHFMSALR